MCALKDRLGSISSSAVEEMQRLIQTSDFKAVQEAFKKFEEYPEDTRSVWEQLQVGPELLFELHQPVCFV